MGRDRGMYLNYGTPGRRRGRRGFGIGTVCAVLLVVILAVIFGVLAYQLSRRNIDELPPVPTSTPVPGTPTPSPTPTPTPTPTSTPTPTATNTPTPLPTSPETGLPCTPTPIPTVWDANYLDNWVDTREKVIVKGAHGGLVLNEKENLNKFLTLVDTTEFNAIVIDVKADSGRVTYQMDCAAAQEAGVCISHYSDMPALLSALKEKGIYCIARVVCFKDNMIDNTHPEWMLHKPDGSMYKDNENETWINPYVKDAWVYIVDIAEQAVLDGFDEICFDYVRVATNGIIAGGNATDGYTYKVDFGPDAEKKTLVDTITDFTIYACNRLKPLGAQVSASVYGAIIRSNVDAKRVGQSYADMSKYLDYICPMVYPSHYAKTYAGIAVPDSEPYKLVSVEMKGSVNKLAEVLQEQETCAEVRPWLQAFSLNRDSSRTYNFEELGELVRETGSYLQDSKGRYYTKYTGQIIREQINAVYDVGYNSWMLWNSSGNYVEGAFLTKEELAAQEAENQGNSTGVTEPGTNSGNNDVGDPEQPENTGEATE